MIANDDRRRVAERLRELGKLAYSPDNTYELMADALGVDDFEGTDELFGRLADLIEPDTTKDTTKSQTISLSPSLCERDALLALADELDTYARCHDDGRCGRQMPPLAIHDFARRIREACGAEP